MNQQDNNVLKDQNGFLKETSNQNPNKVVFEGGTYSNKPTTQADVEKNDDLEHGDHGTTTMTPTNDLPKEAYDETADNNRDDDEDFEDTVGEDHLGFDADNDEPTERELKKTWIGNEKTVHDASAKGLEGEPMGGHNFGKSELELKNDRDTSDAETHSLGWGNSALNTPSEEISNPPEIEEGGEHPDLKKTDD